MTVGQRDIRITDTTLRDGSHAVAHQFTTEHARAVATALDQAGVAVLEVSHGDGLGGSSFNYGFSLTDERELIAIVVDTVEHAKVAALLLPGVGHQGRQFRGRRPRRGGGAHRHPLHRG